MTKNVTFNIPGLHCDGCISSVSRVLESLGGILDIVGDLEHKNLMVTYDQSTITPFAMTKQLEAIGYPTESSVTTD